MGSSGGTREVRELVEEKDEEERSSTGEELVGRALERENKEKSPISLHESEGKLTAGSDSRFETDGQNIRCRIGAK